VELIASRPLASLWKAERADRASREPRHVVIRIAHHTMDPRAMTELRKEYEALRAVSDPRVRKAHGYFAGYGALALEYVDGVSLRWVLERAKEGQLELDVATIVDLGVELCEALRAVHDAGVVHGRLSVESVRLRRDGSPVLTDFAMPQDRLDVLPPELATGTPPTPATDQWLLGALLAHLATQEALLGGEPGNAADGRRDLRSHVAAVAARSPALARIVARMLARDPRDRYGDWGALSRELLATLRTTPGRPDRERLARRAQAGPAAPPLLPPPAPVLGPPPVAGSRSIAGSAAEAEPHRLESRTDVREPERPGPGPGAGADAPEPGEGESALAARVRRQPSARAPVADFEPPEPTQLDPARSARELPRTPARHAAPSAATEIVAPESPEGAELIAIETPRARPERRITPSGADTSRSPVAFTPTAPDLVEAVHDESLTEPDEPAPEEEESVEPPRRSRRSAPHERLVPDWAASFALVLLLAVGAWAVLSRFL
jgi:serine/threonine-protein kinase